MVVQLASSLLSPEPSYTSNVPVVGIERICRFVGESFSTSVKVGVKALKSCFVFGPTLAAIPDAIGASLTAVTLIVTVSVSEVTLSLVTTVRVAYSLPFAFAVGVYVRATNAALICALVPTNCIEVE